MLPLPTELTGIFPTHRWDLVGWTIKQSRQVVGAPRFELGTSCSQSRSQRSSHPTQNGRLAIILKLKALLVLGGFVWERLEAWGFRQLRFYLHSLFPRRRAGLQFADLQGSRVGSIDNYEPGPGSWRLVQVPEI